MSGIEVPTEYGRFPSTWDVLPFSDAIKDVTGGNPKIKSSDYLKSGVLAVVDQGQSDIAGYVDDVTLACKASLPAIVFGDHTKALKFIEQPFALGADGVKVLEPIEKLDKRFVYHYLNQLTLPDNAGYSRHFKFLKEKFIPLPPLPEQRRIAAILDKADAIRRKRQQAIRLTEDFLRSVFLDMFGDPVTNPKGWEVQPLENVVAEGRIVTYGIVQAGPDVEGGIPYIRTGDIKDGKIVTSGLLRTSKEIAQSYRRSEVNIGDLVMSIRATVGTVAPLPDELDGANLTQGTARISPGKNVTKEYLLWAIRAEGSQRWIQRQVKGATFKEITLSKLRELPICVPPLSVQEKFSSTVMQLEKMEDVGLTASSEIENLFNSLVQRAFRGDL